MGREGEYEGGWTREQLEVTFGEADNDQLTINGLAGTLNPAVALGKDRLDFLELVGVAGDEDWSERLPARGASLSEDEGTQA